MLNKEQQERVNRLLAHTSPSIDYHYHSLIAFTLPIAGKSREEQWREVEEREKTIYRLLAETFPTWKVEPFKEHHIRDLFPGKWIARILLPEYYHSLLSMAYYIRWSRLGLIDPDCYNAAAIDSRWNERSVETMMKKVDDPVQWVTDTYGDTLEQQFPLLVHTGRLGSGHYYAIHHPEEDACEETVSYTSPASFTDQLHIKYELERTKAETLLLDESTITVTWQSKVARMAFEQNHPECLV